MLKHSLNNPFISLSEGHIVLKETTHRSFSTVVAHNIGVLQCVPLSVPSSKH